MRHLRFGLYAIDPVIEHVRYIPQARLEAKHLLAKAKTEVEKMIEGK